MKFKSILVPFDGSDHAKEALAAAESLAAGQEGASITVLNVIAASDVNPQFGKQNPFWGTSTDLMDYDDYKAYMDKVLSGARAALEESVAEVAARMGDGLKVDVITFPSTAQAITNYASEHSFDLIVMGRRGLGALRGMLGSVSFGVLSGSDVPVLTIK